MVNYKDIKLMLKKAILSLFAVYFLALKRLLSLARRERLSIPQSSHDVFTLLAQAGWRVT